MNQITKKEINVDIIENNNKKKSKLKIVLLIIAILVVVMAVVAAILIQTKPLLKYRVKKLFGIGVGKTVTTVVKIDNDDVEKILVGEFTRRENVDFNQSLMLINTNYTLSEDFVADIEEYKTSTVMMNKSMTADYAKLSQSVIDKFDQKLFVMSSVRTAEEQQELYDELGAETAVPPGASEHQSALALDVYVTGYAGAGFLQSEVGVYVNENCQNYGFIIRYPEHGTDITGISFEPWHIRYVDLPHSKIIANNKLTLEEYIDTMEIGKFYECDGYIYIRQKMDDEILVPLNCREYVISPDNTGCYIITGKR